MVEAIRNPRGSLRSAGLRIGALLLAGGIGVLASACKNEPLSGDPAGKANPLGATTKTEDGWVVFTPSNRAFTVEAPKALIEFPGDVTQPSSVIYQLVASDGKYAYTIARWEIKSNSTGAIDPKSAMSATFAKLAKQYDGDWDEKIRVLSDDNPTLLGGTITDAKMPGSDQSGTVIMRWHIADGVTHQLQAIHIDPLLESTSRRFLDSFRLTQP